MHLRQAQPADYDRIIAVVDGWWGRRIHTALPRLFLDHFFRTSFVAEDDDALAGFLVGLFSGSDRDVAYIHVVGVDPRLRGSGLASRLYGRFFDLARADGRSVIRAITAPHNDGSIAFHQAMGFTVTGPITDYNGPSADRILFHRRLDISHPEPPTLPNEEE